MNKTDNNTNVFFSLLRAGLWEQDVCLLPLGNFDYNEIYRMAEEQAVLGIVAAGLEHVVDLKAPQDVSLQIVGQTIQIERRNTAMNHFIGSLIDKMRNAGIYTLLLKGQGVAQCYEKPLWRACGDVDFFLSDDNYEYAKNYLKPLTSSVDLEHIAEKHISMTIDGFVVELHGTLNAPLSFSIRKGLEEIKRAVFYEGKVRSWINGNTQVFLLNADEDAVYLFVHFFNHFYKEGVGLRQICDWCRLLWTYRDEIDVKKIENRVHKMGLMSEWKAFAALAVEYLGMPKEAMPFYSESICWKRKADRIMEFILKSGNMGHNRDMSHFSKYPYLIRKCVSMGRRIGDLINHARIFPLDSLRFFPRIMFNGVRSAMRGE